MGRRPQRRRERRRLERWVRRGGEWKREWVVVGFLVVGVLGMGDRRVRREERRVRV